VAGFVALAWYAYHAGTQSVKDEDLLVVEADKTPMKEKPVDAGGMQFPDQDKTIFETFGNAKQLPKVERVLPTPEEPVAVEADTGTTTWINDKFHKKSDEAGNANPKAEPVIPPAAPAEEKQNVAAETKKPVAAEEIPPVDVASGNQQIAAAKSPQEDNQTASYIAKVSEDNAADNTASSAPEKDKAPPVKNKTAAHAAVSSDNGDIRVQLGAYRSEKEAQDAWNAMQKKHGDLLAAAQPNIVKADLGARGVYYRLRVGGFASAAEAGAMCGKLAAGGQPCIVAAR